MLDGPLQRALQSNIAEPLARDLGPYVILYPGLRLVADPARFSRKNKCRFTLQWEEDIHIAVDDLKTGHIKDRALKPGVLVPAHQERIQFRLLHVGADILIAPFNLFLTWQV